MAPNAAGERHSHRWSRSRRRRWPEYVHRPLMFAGNNPRRTARQRIGRPAQQGRTELQRGRNTVIVGRTEVGTTSVRCGSQVGWSFACSPCSRPSACSSALRWLLRQPRPGNSSFQVTPSVPSAASRHGRHLPPAHRLTADRPHPGDGGLTSSSTIRMWIVHLASRSADAVTRPRSTPAPGFASLTPAVYVGGLGETL